MSYEPTEWKTGDIVTAQKLNNLEEGNKNNSDSTELNTKGREIQQRYASPVGSKFAYAINNENDVTIRYRINSNFDGLNPICCYILGYQYHADIDKLNVQIYSSIDKYKRFTVKRMWSTDPEYSDELTLDHYDSIGSSEIFNGDSFDYNNYSWTKSNLSASNSLTCRFALCILDDEDNVVKAFYSEQVKFTLNNGTVTYEEFNYIPTDNYIYKMRLIKSKATKLGSTYSTEYSSMLIDTTSSVSGTSVTKNEELFSKTIPYSLVDDTPFCIVSSVGNNNYVVQNLYINPVPDAPASDGEYLLKCTVLSGVKTYSWEDFNNATLLATE